MQHGYLYETLTQKIRRGERIGEAEIIVERMIRSNPSDVPPYERAVPNEETAAAPSAAAPAPFRKLLLFMGLVFLIFFAINISLLIYKK